MRPETFQTLSQLTVAIGVRRKKHYSNTQRDLESLNGVEIGSFIIQGDTIPPMSEVSYNENKTAMKILYRSIAPSIFKVIIKMPKKTSFNTSIVPLKVNK